MASPPPPPDPVFTLRGHQGDVTSVIFHPANQTIISTSVDNTVRIWDIKTRRAIFEMRLNAPVLWAQALPGERILAQCRGGNVSILNANASMETAITMQTNSVGFCKCAVLGDTMAMPGEEDGQVCLWDLRTGQQGALLSVPDVKTGLCMAIQLYAQKAIGFFENGCAYLWDIAAPSIVVAHAKLQSDPALSADNKSGIAGSAGTALMRFSLTDKGFECGPAVPLPQAGINDVRIRNDEKIYATAGWDHRVRVFSWRKNTPLAVLRFHTAAVSCVAFQPSSNLVAAASADARIAVWAIY